MSSKKDKFIDNAQKLVLKGQLSRAVKEYEQALAIDPKDVRTRQRLAELLVRDSRKDEAIREYETLGNFYADNHFYLKATAVYKQIQKLNPANLNTYLILASLSEKQGLIGNALAEYKVVYDTYEKSNSWSDAVVILEKMQLADKENLNIKIKLAETRLKAGQTDQAYEDYKSVALSLKARGDESGFRKIGDRIQTLFPNSTEFSQNVIAPAPGEPTPTAGSSKQKNEPETKEALLGRLYQTVDDYRASGDTDSVKQVLLQIVRDYPNEIPAMEALVACAIDEGDLDTSLLLLKAYADDFYAKKPEIIERSCEKLLEVLPGNEQILGELKEFYERTGNIAKLDKLNARMAVSTPEPEPPSFMDVERTELSQTTAGGAVAEEQASPWDDEIELELDFGADEAPPSPAPKSTAASFAELTTPDRFDVDYSTLEEVPDSEIEESIPSRAAAALDELLQGDSSGSDDFDSFSGLSGLDDIEIEITDENELSFGESVVTEEEYAIELDFAEPSPENIETDAPVSIDVRPDNDSIAEDFLSTGFTSEELDDFSSIIGDDDAKPERTLPGPAAADKYGTEGLINAFKIGVGQQLDQGDTETHYNLGIAYKEMGLFDEAIGEFQAASVDSSRRVDSLTLQGICYREKNEFSKAEDIFKAGINLSSLSDEEMLSLKYELALLYEMAGRDEEALAEYRQVYAIDGYFRDTIQKIARLQCEDEAIDLADLELIDLENEEHE